MKVTGPGYRVVYDSETVTVTFEGALRLLGGEGYGPVKQLLDDVVAGKAQAVTVDVRRLEFLNSQGIVLVTRFMMDLRDLTTCQITVHGTPRHRWQARWLRNMEKLVPEMWVDLEQGDQRGDPGE
jgi:hypothetical protein